MSVIFRTVERPSDPRVENSPKKYFPQLVTLGQSVNLAFIAQKMVFWYSMVLKNSGNHNELHH